VFCREHCGQALVRHPDEGVHLAKFPGKLALGSACIGAAEDRRGGKNLGAGHSSAVKVRSNKSTLKPAAALAPEIRTRD